MSKKITKMHSGGKSKGKTDWARIDGIAESELERSISADVDAELVVDWTKARLVMQQRKEFVHLRLDPDVLAWFRGQGQGYLTRMNAALRAYMDAQRPR